MGRLGRFIRVLSEFARLLRNMPGSAEAGKSRLCSGWRVARCSYYVLGVESGKVGSCCVLKCLRCHLVGGELELFLANIRHQRDGSEGVAWLALG